MEVSENDEKSKSLDWNSAPLDNCRILLWFSYMDGSAILGVLSYFRIELSMDSGICNILCETNTNTVMFIQCLSCNKKSQIPGFTTNRSLWRTDFSRVIHFLSLEAFYLRL